MSLKTVVEYELPRLRKVIKDLDAQGSSLGTLPQIYAELAVVLAEEKQVISEIHSEAIFKSLKLMGKI